MPAWEIPSSPEVFGPHTASIGIGGGVIEVRIQPPFVPTDDILHGEDIDFVHIASGQNATLLEVTKEDTRDLTEHATEEDRKEVIDANVTAILEKLGRISNKKSFMEHWK